MDEFEAGYWRMVQRLQTTLVGNASVQRSKGRGHGLFAARDLARGEYITTYWGRLAYHSEVKGRPLRETTHMRTLILQFLLVDGERTVAPRNGIGLASFANNAGWSEEVGGFPRLRPPPMEMDHGRAATMPASSSTQMPPIKAWCLSASQNILGSASREGGGGKERKENILWSVCWWPPHSSPKERRSLRTMAVPIGGGTSRRPPETQ